jgi:hypothetical protein
VGEWESGGVEVGEKPKGMKRDLAKLDGNIF